MTADLAYIEPHPLHVHKMSSRNVSGGTFPLTYSMKPETEREVERGGEKG